MEPARGESCTSGQRRRPAARGEVKFPSADEKSLYTSTTFNNPEIKKEISRVDTAPRGVENPLHQPIADWLGLMELAGGESCPTGQRRGPPHSGSTSTNTNKDNWHAAAEQQSHQQRIQK